MYGLWKILLSNMWRPETFEMALVRHCYNETGRRVRKYCISGPWPVHSKRAIWLFRYFRITCQSLFLALFCKQYFGNIRMCSGEVQPIRMRV